MTYCRINTKTTSVWLSYVTSRAKYIAEDGSKLIFVLPNLIPSDLSHPLTYQPSLFQSVNYVYTVNREVIIREYLGLASYCGCKIYNSKQELVYNNELVF